MMHAILKVKMAVVQMVVVTLRDKTKLSFRVGVGRLKFSESWQS